VHSSYAKKALADIYDHKKLEGFPLGIRLRFVPDIVRVSDSNDKIKLSTSIGLQSKFTKKIGSYSNGEIRNIDAKLPNGVSIRDFLMALKVNDEKQKPLFVAINPDTYKGGYLFLFFPQFCDEATNTLMHLLVRFRNELYNHKQDDIDILFNDTAQERANESFWDPTTKTATTAESQYIGGIMEALTTYDLLYTFPNDNDSVKQSSTKSEDDDSDKSSEDDKRNAGKLSIGEVSTVVTTKTFSKEPESVLRKPNQPKQVSPDVKVVSFPGQRYNPSFNNSKYNDIKYGDTTSITSGITLDEVNKKIEQKIKDNNSKMFDYMMAQQQQTSAQQVQLDAIQKAVMQLAASSEKGGGGQRGS
jgi:hypothetical protein